jgi:hypothetical protein
MKAKVAVALGQKMVSLYSCFIKIKNNETVARCEQAREAKGEEKVKCKSKNKNKCSYKIKWNFKFKLLY